MQIHTEQFEIEMIDEPMYSFGSSVNSRQYAKEYLLGENYRDAPRYGITVRSADGSISSCIVLANGGLSTVHENSTVVMGDHLFVAIGNSICCVEIPSLVLKWHQQVDTATCFGVYVSPDNKSIISHGEVDIAKLSFDGEIEWSVSGKDIFSEGFQLFPDHIEAIDFNHEKYRVEISTGRISIKNGG